MWTFDRDFSVTMTVSTLKSSTLKVFLTNFRNVNLILISRFLVFR